MDAHVWLSMWQAISARDARGGVFTQDVIDTWIEYKRIEEHDTVALRPHPYEFGLYYDV